MHRLSSAADFHQTRLPPDSMSSQIPDTDTAARIWTNQVTRDTLCGHIDRRTLLVLLRLSKDSFNAVVPYVWGGRRDDIRLRGEEADVILTAVKNIVCHWSTTCLGFEW